LEIVAMEQETSPSILLPLSSLKQLTYLSEPSSWKEKSTSRRGSDASQGQSDPSQAAFLDWAVATTTTSPLFKQNRNDNNKL
jgi:hypothetical protein